MKRESVIIAIGITSFLGLVGLVGGWESRYKMDAVCAEYSNGVYTFEDTNGNEWQWEDSERMFAVGQPYVLRMDDNHTTQITDDWIKKIEKNKKKG